MSGHTECGAILSSDCATLAAGARLAGASVVKLASNVDFHRVLQQPIHKALAKASSPSPELVTQMAQRYVARNYSESGCLSKAVVAFDMPAEPMLKITPGGRNEPREAPAESCFLSTLNFRWKMRYGVMQ